MCTLAIDRFAELLPVFQEAYRVLDRGRFVILTATTVQMQSYRLNEYFPDALLKSIEQMLALDLVTGALTQAGFTSIDTKGFDIRDDFQDFFLYSGKYRPDMYLDEGVRRGISTFASLADPEEVTSGCLRLAEDIQSGRIDEVRASYENQGGDYRSSSQPSESNYGGLSRMALVWGSPLIHRNRQELIPSSSLSS